MSSMPVLLVEDEEAAAERFALLLDETCRRLGAATDLHLAHDCQEGQRAIESGVYPLIVVDLNLPDPLASAQHDVVRYRGLDLLELVLQNNKDTVTCAYTAYGAIAVPELRRVRLQTILSKLDTDDVLVNEIGKAVAKAIERFNYQIDPGIEEVVSLTRMQRLAAGKLEQWTVCLRRQLARVKHCVSYDALAKGFSAGGVVSAFCDERLPVVFKFHLFDILKDEVQRYEEFVREYIPRKAHTGAGDLAQSAKVGVLRYSFVGVASKPESLADAIMSKEPQQVAEAIREHFNANCERWFASEAGMPRPYGLASKCLNRLRVDIEGIRDLCAAPGARGAIETAAGHLRECTKVDLVDTVCDALAAPRRKLHCKPECIVHGDLNVRNLVWGDDGRLWMIDFEETERGPRILDFVKLEASIKYDVRTPFPERDRDRLASILAAEDKTLSSFSFDTASLGGNPSDGVARKASAIRAVRSSAADQWGSHHEMEYWLALLFVTAKHVEYLAGEIKDDDTKHVPLAHALVSAYRLAKMVEGTVAQR